MRTFAAALLVTAVLGNDTCTTMSTDGINIYDISGVTGIVDKTWSNRENPTYADYWKSIPVGTALNPKSFDLRFNYCVTHEILNNGTMYASKSVGITNTYARKNFPLIGAVSLYSPENATDGVIFVQEGSTCTEDDTQMNKFETTINCDEAITGELDMAFVTLSVATDNLCVAQVETYHKAGCGTEESVNRRALV